MSVELPLQEREEKPSSAQWVTKNQMRKQTLKDDNVQGVLQCNSWIQGLQVNQMHQHKIKGLVNIYEER